MKKATVFRNKLPVPVYLGEYTDAVWHLFDRKIRVGYPNRYGVEIFSAEHTVLINTHDFITKHLPKVSAINPAGQGMYRFNVDVSDVSVDEFVNLLEQLTTALEIFY